MTAIRWLLNKLFPFPVDEYIARFIVPQVERLSSLGVSDQDVQRLVIYAHDIADPTVVGLAPGSLLAKFADIIEAGGTVNGILPKEYQP